MKRIGIYGFTGCAGDQLTILHSEDELLYLFKEVVVKSFLMAKRDNEEVDLDIAFVEGSINTKEQLERLKEIRGRTEKMVAIGMCACYGGPQHQSMDNWEERFKRVYGEKRIEIESPTPPQPIDALVKVDHYLPGCPINKDQFFHLLTKLIRGIPPDLCKHPVCVECKLRENWCLLLNGIPCLGPITLAGCGAVCPSYNLPCVGCFGPVEEANLTSEYNLLKEKGIGEEEIKRRLGLFGVREWKR